MGAFSLIVVINLLNRATCVLMNMVQNELAHCASQQKTTETESNSSSSCSSYSDRHQDSYDNSSSHPAHTIAPANLNNLQSPLTTAAPSTQGEERSPKVNQERPASANGDQVPTTHALLQRSTDSDGETGEIDQKAFAADELPALQVNRRFRVGYWLPEKTIKLIKWSEFIELSKNRGIDLIELDLDTELDSLLPLDLVFHKIIALYKPKLRGKNSNFDTHFKRLLAFIESSPESSVIDPVNAQLQLFNREYVCKLISSVCSEVNIAQARNAQTETAEQETLPKLRQPEVKIPVWHKILQAPKEITELECLEGLKLPCICKCVNTWEENSHEMSIVFNWNQLLSHSERIPSPSVTANSKRAAVALSYPIILQNFVRHQEVLFKVYVIGQQIVVQKRPSVDIPSSHTCNTQPIHFNGHKISKQPPKTPTNSDKVLNGLENRSIRPHSSLVNTTEIDEAVSCDMKTVHRVVEAIKSRINLEIFGLDFLVSSVTNTHYIIDVNPFPGCSSLDNIHQYLLDLLLSRLS